MARKKKFTHINEDDIDCKEQEIFYTCSQCLTRLHKDYFTHTKSQQLNFMTDNIKKARLDLRCIKCMSTGGQDTSKRCYKCEQIKPLGAFSKSQRKMGDYARCLSCILHQPITVSDEDGEIKEKEDKEKESDFEDDHRYLHVHDAPVVKLEQEIPKQRIGRDLTKLGYVLSVDDLY